jgi:hypothetical protein
MGRVAQVKSIDALQAMTAALACFHDDASSALDDLDMEIRRILQWISHDCGEYWRQEVRRARDRVTEARLQLENARTFRRFDKDRPPSCIEEKKALEQAKRRLQIAESKLEVIPHWAVTIERAVNEYRASRSTFAYWLEADFPRAVAALGRMITSLEAYVALAKPTNDHSPIDREAATSTNETNASDVPDNKSDNNPESKILNPEP